VIARWQLLGGDCRAVLATLEPDSVDACVTDPPYELGFMGKAWDRSGVAFDPETWRAVLRVLKPGGHLLAFGGTRTVHRIACAIEDAGFDIRDQLSWLYGSGFPKSLDVSKAIDAAAGATRPIGGKTSTACPSFPQPCPGHPSANGSLGGGVMRHAVPTAPATDSAKQWAGWGTALKPACEPIVLARKPLIGTVAANVLAHGTGGINVDGCRIAHGADVDMSAIQRQQVDNDWGGIARSLIGKEISKFKAGGRWPANVILDEEAAALLDEQSGTSKSTGGIAAPQYDRPLRMGRTSGDGANAGGLGDSGGASRFFYVAKASRRERDAGCEQLPPKSAGEATDRDEDTDGLNSPRAGAGRTGGARNFHPTVKPVQLMRYLVRLVTPLGGVVLDPFTGSGTTGIAALREGARFVGVDLEPEYARLAIARIEEDEPLFNRRRGE
jgi:site-specific DNA-methyltransferase (adenine-specific)